MGSPSLPFLRPCAARLRASQPTANPALVKPVIDAAMGSDTRMVSPLLKADRLGYTDIPG